jgi:hypothetical protein
MSIFRFPASLSLSSIAKTTALTHPSAHPMSIFHLPAHHVRHNLRFLRFALPLLACSLATPVFGQTSWEGDVSNSWGEAGNWTNGVPTLSTDATFPSTTGTTSITISAPPTGTTDAQNIFFTGGDD